MGAWGAAAAGDNDGRVRSKVAGAFFNTCGVDEGDRQRRRACSRAAGGPGRLRGAAGGREAGPGQAPPAWPLPSSSLETASGSGGCHRLRREPSRRTPSGVGRGPFEGHAAALPGRAEGAFELGQFSCSQCFLR